MPMFKTERTTDQAKLMLSLGRHGTTNQSVIEQMRKVAAVNPGWVNFGVGMASVSLAGTSAARRALAKTKKKETEHAGC